MQELVRGGNLLHKVYKQMLNRQKCVYTSQEALNWLMDVAEGMLYLHTITENKPMIIHRDLKLENIMLMPDITGTVAKLVDFGLHKVIDDRIKRVVKRVMSEANMRGGLARYRAAADEVEEDDELEVALAQQREQQAQQASQSGQPSGSLSPSSSSGALSAQMATSRFSPLRRETGSTLQAHSEEENEGEEEEEETSGSRPQNGQAASTNSRGSSFSANLRSPLSRAPVPEEGPAPAADVS